MLFSVRGPGGEVGIESECPVLEDVAYLIEDRFFLGGGEAAEGIVGLKWIDEPCDGKQSENDSKVTKWMMRCFRHSVVNLLQTRGVSKRFVEMEGFCETLQ